MSDMICRVSMTRCMTPGTCSPHGGCPAPANQEVARLKALLVQRDHFLRDLATGLSSAAQKCMQYPHAMTENTPLGLSFLATVGQINQLLAEQP